jgi:hypothetical protein
MWPDPLCVEFTENGGTDILRSANLYSVPVKGDKVYLGLDREYRVEEVEWDLPEKASPGAIVHLRRIVPEFEA